MLDLSFQEVSPLEDYLEVAKGMLVLQVYGVQLASKLLSEHPDTDTYLLWFLFGVVAASLGHFLCIFDALAEVDKSIVPQKRKTDNDALSLLVHNFTWYKDVPLVGKKKSKFDRIAQSES